MSLQAAASDRAASPLLRSTGMDRHGNIVPRLDRLLGALQIRLGPRRQMQVAAFLGELPGAGQADSLGRAGDECKLAAQIQIHGHSLLLERLLAR